MSSRNLIFLLAALEVLAILPIASFPALMPDFIAIWSLSNTEAGWIAGVYYLKEDSLLAQDIRFGDNGFPGAHPSAAGITPPNLFDVIPNPYGNTVSFSIADLEDQSASVYGQVDYEFAERWNATLGLRYTQDKKSNPSYYAGAFLKPTPWDPSIFIGEDAINFIALHAGEFPAAGFLRSQALAFADLRGGGDARIDDGVCRLQLLTHIRAHGFTLTHFAVSRRASETGNENDSPRGRIYLMRAVTDGRLDLSDDVRRHLELCLDCRGCETACPSGVQYGKLIEPFRVAMETGSEAKAKTSDWFHRWILYGLFPWPNRMRWALAPARLAQRLGVMSAVEPSLPEDGARRQTTVASTNGCPRRDRSAASARTSAFTAPGYPEPSMWSGRLGWPPTPSRS